MNQQIKEKIDNEIPTMINTAFENKIIYIKKRNKKEFYKINKDMNNVNITLEKKIMDLNSNILKDLHPKKKPIRKNLRKKIIIYH